MPGQPMQHHYWYPYACPPNPSSPLPPHPLHSTRRYARLSHFCFCQHMWKQTPAFLKPIHVYLLWNRPISLCQCGELEGVTCPHALHGYKGDGGYDQAPIYGPPTWPRSKAKDYKRGGQRGAQPRSYDGTSLGLLIIHSSFIIGVIHKYTMHWKLCVPCDVC